MKAEIKPAVDDVRRLQGCINDLIAIQALAAVWSGQKPSRIVASLLEVLVRVLRLDFAYARLSDSVSRTPIEMIQLGPHRMADVQPQGMGRALDRWLTDDPPTSSQRVPNPIGAGELSIAPFRLGLQEKIGVLLAGSARLDFPTEIERLLLRVATNQAAIGLHEARLLSEQKRTAEELEQNVAERTANLIALNEDLKVEIAERERAEKESSALKDELAAELTAMNQLHEFSTRLVASRELQSLLEEVLNATMALQSADFGNVQLYNRETQALEIVAQRGFESGFLDYFGSVREDSAACGRALKRRERVIIEDVQCDPAFTPHRQIAAAAGFRAVQSTPLFSRNGAPLGMLSTHFRQPHRPSERELGLTDLYVMQAAEMIELKRAEDELRGSERRFRLRVESIPHHVWSYLPDGSIGYYNQQLADYVGLTAEELQQGGLAALHPSDVEHVKTAWREARLQGTLYEVEQRLRGRDGRYRRFVCRAMPVHDAQGNVVEWYGTNTDVEERRLAEEALQKAHAELAHLTRVMTLGELTASIAHEVSQPLGAAITNGSACLRWLARETPDLGEARAAVERMIRDANRASDVIRRIRTLVKKTDMQKAWLQTNDIVHEVISLVQSEVRKNEVALTTELCADLPPVLGDRIQLQQVLLNLIINGIDAMHSVADRPRQLLISSEKLNAGEVLVAVRDSGIGLQSEIMEQIFKAFYTTKPNGLGMGLSISHSIIAAHNGRLWATPNSGPGATFQFTLPAYIF